jgi:hypothetical protein
MKVLQIQVLIPFDRLNSMFCHSERSRGISLPSRGISRQARNDKVLMISVGGGFQTLPLQDVTLFNRSIGIRTQMFRNPV